MDAEKLFEATKKGDFWQVRQILETLNDTTKERTTIRNALKRLNNSLSNHKFNDEEKHQLIETVN